MLKKIADFSKNHPLLGTLTVIFLARLLLAAFVPLTQDEAYYQIWSSQLDWGYFDHPPAIAWLTSLSQYWPDSAFSVRLLGVIVGLAQLWLTTRLARAFGFEQRAVQLAALILVATNLAGWLVGFLATPDIPFTLGWTLALHEAAYALRGQRWRWLTAGLATGLGLWGKYAMLMMGPIFLWALSRKREELRKPWPYLGGVCCLLIFLPHLWWNAHHDWLPLRFQMNHGLKGSHEVPDHAILKVSSPLPPMDGTVEAHLARYFLTAEDLKPPKPPKSWLQKTISQVSDFIGSQIFLWGLLLIPMGVAFFQNRRSNTSEKAPTLDPSVKALQQAATWFPLALFGLITFKQPIEANWPAIYTIGAATMLAPYLINRQRLLISAAAINGILLLAVGLHMRWPLSSSKPQRDRFLNENHGYQDLANYLRYESGPIFADSYQIVAMVRHYAPDLKINQWPGITRYSEFTRRSEFVTVSMQDIVQRGRFFLVTSQLIPPRLPSYTPIKLWELRDCLSGDLMVTEVFSKEIYTPPCEARVHRWFLVEYELNFHGEENELEVPVPRHQEIRLPLPHAGDAGDL